MNFVKTIKQDSCLERLEKRFVSIENFRKNLVAIMDFRDLNVIDFVLIVEFLVS